MKTCIACGMPMSAKEDYPMGDESKEYCRFCARPDGAMQTFEEKLENMTEFIQSKQGLDQETARDIAKSMMLTLPAWR